VQKGEKNPKVCGGGEVIPPLLIKKNLAGRRAAKLGFKRTKREKKEKGVNRGGALFSQHVSIRGKRSERRHLVGVIHGGRHVSSSLKSTSSYEGSSPQGG